MKTDLFALNTIVYIKDEKIGITNCYDQSGFVKLNWIWEVIWYIAEKRHGITDFNLSFMIRCHKYIRWRLIALACIVIGGVISVGMLNGYCSNNSYAWYLPFGTVLRPDYSEITRSIPWLLMLPRRQINKNLGMAMQDKWPLSVVFVRKNFNYLPITLWRNDSKSKCIM